MAKKSKKLGSIEIRFGAEGSGVLENRSRRYETIDFSSVDVEELRAILAEICPASRKFTSFTISASRA